MTGGLLLERQMRSKHAARGGAFRKVLAIVIAGFVSVPSEGAPKPDSSSAPRQRQKEFNTPQEAVDSLIQAAGSFDVTALKEILGPEGADIISSEDPIADKERAAAFAAKAKEKMTVAPHPKFLNRVILMVG